MLAPQEVAPYVILIPIIMVGAAFLTAFLAQRKAYNPFLWFFTAPVVALCVLAFLPNAGSPTLTGDEPLRLRRRGNFVGGLLTALGVLGGVTFNSYTAPQYPVVAFLNAAGCLVWIWLGVLTRPSAGRSADLVIVGAAVYIVPIVLNNWLMDHLVRFYLDSGREVQSLLSVTTPINRVLWSGGSLCLVAGALVNRSLLRNMSARHGACLVIGVVSVLAASTAVFLYPLTLSKAPISAFIIFALWGTCLVTGATFARLLGRPGAFLILGSIIHLAAAVFAFFLEPHILNQYRASRRAFESMGSLLWTVDAGLFVVSTSLVVAAALIGRDSSTEPAGTSSTTTCDRGTVSA